MFVDPLSPVAPSRIRVLLLPCGSIIQSKFLSFVGRLQRAGPVQLSDLPVDEAPNSFSPSSNPSGTIFYDLTATFPSPAHQALSPFEIYREPLVVIAIADGSTLEPASSWAERGRGAQDGAADEEVTTSKELLHHLEQLQEISNLIKEQHPSALVHRVFTFDCAAATHSISKPLVMIPLESAEMDLKHILWDLTTDLLMEMDSYAISLQALPTIETPRYPHARQPEHEFIPESRLAGTRNARSNSPAEHGRSSSRALPGDPLAVPSPTDPSSRSSSAGPATTFDQMGNIVDRDAMPEGTSATHATDRVVVHGFGSGSVGERARNKAKGRQGIILGSLYLLAGNWPRAIKELSESAASAKVSNDHVWHAKALETILICLLLCAWSGADVDIPSICYPLGERTRPAPGKTTVPDPGGVTPVAGVNARRTEMLHDLSSLLPDLFTNILNLYVRAATFTADQLPQIAFSESAIRFAKLLATVEAYHGVLHDRCLQSIVLDAKVEATQPMVSSASFPSKSDISTLLFRALPNPSAESHLDTQERIGILTGLASVLSRLNYHRKKAFILRQLLTLLLPALVQSRKDSAAEQGVHPFASLAPLDVSPSGATETVSNGLQSLLHLTCHVYGVVSSVQPEEHDDAHADAHRILERAAIRSFGNHSLKLDMLRLCISISEALPDLTGVLAFSGDLLVTSGSGVAPRPHDRGISPLLSLEDQIRLLNNIYRASSATQSPIAEADYWDEFLVRDIKLVTSLPLHGPTIREKAQLDSVGFDGPAKADGPFIYNPFAAKAGSGVVELLIADEEATFTILLQNLYDFDLEIEWIRLASNDSSMDTTARNVVVGPCRTLTIPLPDIPRATGQLHITGCLAKIRGCKERNFPLYRASWKARETPKLKCLGLSNVAMPNHTREEWKAPLATSGPTPSHLTLAVIETQPNLVVTASSLSQSALMLLEGEQTRFSIQLYNTSSRTPVDLLALSFTDSTSGPLQAKISSKTLSPLEIHDAEVSAYHHPPFRLQPASQSEYIAPHGDFGIDVAVLGKPGLTRGAIHIDYGHIGVPKSEVADRFYTQQLAFPFAVTVSPSIKLIQADLIGHDAGAFSSEAFRPGNGNGPLDTSTLATEDHVLLLLDFANGWSRVLTVSLQVRLLVSGSAADLETEASYTIQEAMQPGTTSRIMVLLPKLSLAGCHAPIPSLNPTKRQYVVSTSKTPSEVERTNREVFWYREEILKQLHATWNDSSSERTGDIDLHALNVTPRMIEVLKADDVGIELSLDSAEQANGTRHCLVKREAFVDLVVTITNRLSHPIHPMVRLLPALSNQPSSVALDLSKKLAFNGLLQRPMPPLHPTESRQIHVGCVFLCSGRFEFSASVEELRPLRTGAALQVETKGTRTGVEELEEGKPRIWYPRHVLRIDAFDT